MTLQRSPASRNLLAVQHYPDMPPPPPEDKTRGLVAEQRYPDLPPEGADQPRLLLAQQRYPDMPPMDGTTILVPEKHDPVLMAAADQPRSLRTQQRYPDLPPEPTTDQARALLTEQRYPDLPPEPTTDQPRALLAQQRYPDLPPEKTPELPPNEDFRVLTTHQRYPDDHFPDDPPTNEPQLLMADQRYPDMPEDPVDGRGLSVQQRYPDIPPFEPSDGRDLMAAQKYPSQALLAQNHKVIARFLGGEGDTEVTSAPVEMAFAANEAALPDFGNPARLLNSNEALVAVGDAKATENLQILLGGGLLFIIAGVAFRHFRNKENKKIKMYGSDDETIDDDAYASFV